MRLPYQIIIGALVCFATPARAQSGDSLNLSTIGKDSRWKISGRTVSAVEIKGKHAIKISEGEGMGVVWLDGYDFANGTIDVDLLGRGEPVQGSL